LTGYVQDAEIGAIAQQHPPEEAVDKLVNLANERGGSDNIAVVIASAQDQEARVPTVVAAPAEPSVIQRLTRAMGVVAGVLLATLIVLGGYYVFTRRVGPEETTARVETPAMTAQVGGVLPTATLAATTGDAAGVGTAALTAANTGAPTASPGAVAGEPTVTLAPTVASSTPVPAPTESQGPSAVQPTATPPPPTSTPRHFTAPSLQEPKAGAALSGEQRFTWQWVHQPLPDDYYFDLRIWSTDEDDLPNVSKRGAVEPSKRTEANVDLGDVPAIRDYGTGPYFWTVVVVRKGCDECTPEIVGDWGEQRSFTYEIKGPRQRPTPARDEG
jgi:hypothetical protein